MPRLILLRHAKSDWDAGGSDLLRPLAARGRRNAATVGRFLAATGHVPGSVVSSPATRALQTIELAMAAGGWSCPLRTSELLYSGGIDGLLEEISCEPQDTELLLAVGHEPTWSQATALLTGGVAVRFATATMACVELQRFAYLGDGSGVLGWLVPPRIIAAVGPLPGDEAK